MRCRLMLMLLALTCWYGHAKPLVIAGPPYVTGLLSPIYAGWFNQAGLEITYIPCGLARCRELAKRGAVDGEALRTGEYGKTNRHLVRIDVPLTESAFYGLSLDPLVANQSLQQLLDAKKQFGCLRGNYWCEQTIPDAQRTQLNSLTQGLPLLLRKRIDIMIVADWHTPSYLPKAVEGVTVVSTRLYKGYYYLYLTNQHITEAEKLQQAWSKLVNSPAWPSLSAPFIESQRQVLQAQYNPQP